MKQNQLPNEILRSLGFDKVAIDPLIKDFVSFLEMQGVQILLPSATRVQKTISVQSESFKALLDSFLLEYSTQNMRLFFIRSNARERGHLVFAPTQETAPNRQSICLLKNFDSYSYCKEITIEELSVIARQSVHLNWCARCSQLVYELDYFIRINKLDSFSSIVKLIK